jgi:hypothetical protein
MVKKIKSTEATVFIIESLEKEESDSMSEGKIISRTLKLSGKGSEYSFVRTKDKFRNLIKKFGKSKHRYLHISIHGNNQDIGPKNWDISASELALMLKPCIKNRRLFLSSCSGADGQFALEILKISRCYSVVAPIGKICFDDAAVFWISFYHLMFLKDRQRMKTMTLLNIAERCANFVEMPFMIFYKSRNIMKQKMVGRKGKRWLDCQKD